jgi:RNAse (barnase) inhibitor barstar
MILGWIGYEDSKQKIGEYAEKFAKVLHEAEQEISGFRVIIKN